MKSPCTGMTGPRFPYRRQTNEMVDLGKPSNRTYVVSWMSKFSTRMCKLVSSISTVWLVQRISQLPVCSLKWSPNDSVGNHFKILCVIGLGPRSLHDSGSSEGVSLSIGQGTKLRQVGDQNSFLPWCFFATKWSFKGDESARTIRSVEENRHECYEPPYIRHLGSSKCYVVYCEVKCPFRLRRHFTSCLLYTSPSPRDA